MADQITTNTNEFSIVLLANDETADKVTRLRELLPPSPVRVDPPHMTLLRGISAPGDITDQELLEGMKPLVTPFLSEISKVYAKHVTTLDSRIYGPTAVVELEIPSALREARASLVTKLLDKHYSVLEVEQNNYQPHITLALSVPLPDNEDHSEIMPPDSVIHFSGFALFRTRIRQQDGTRLVTVLRS